MYGVVSLLDEKHNALVENIWSEFRQKFGIHGVSVTPIAHFSYHVAPEYDMDRLTQKLETITNSTRPFIVNTNGLGIFTGDDLVLYVPVQLNSSLVALNEQLWDALSDVAHNPVPYYCPCRWQSHITLTHKDVDHDLLPKIIRLLSERDFYWEITIDNLTVLGNEPDGILARLPFG